MTRRQNLGEALAQEAQSAIQDIRARFEEVFYGRRLSIDPVRDRGMDREAEGLRPSSFDEIWGRATQGLEQPARERDLPEIER